MSEAAVRDLASHAHACSKRLTRAVGEMAGRIADLLAGLPPERNHASSRAFLHLLAEQANAAPLVRRRSSAEPEPIERLVNAYAFSEIDRALMLLAGMAEESEGLASVLASLHPSSEPRASAGLAAQLFCRTNDERRELRAHLELGAAVSSGAVRLVGAGPLFNRTLELAPSLWSALHGVDAWPLGLTPDRSHVALSGLSDWLATPDAQRARRAIRSRDTRTIVFSGDDVATAAHRAAALAYTAGVASARLTIVPSHSREQRQWLELHVVARGILPIVTIAPSDDDKPSSDTALPMSRCPGPVVLCTRPGSRASVARPLVEVAIQRMTPRSRVSMWRDQLPELAHESERLSMSYSVEPDAAAALATDARSLASLEERTPTLEDLAASVRARGQSGETAGVSLRRATATWSQLVLAPDRITQLEEVIHRLRHQPRVLDDWGFLRNRAGARGVRILISGPPGTGKTLAAEVLAHTLGVDLLVADLSKIVSKWLGETEKNLSSVFDVAERAQAVLLFDEADALFGRRTEVSDAHDRYANLETAYLLTRLERFEGLAVLSTNLQRNLDSAFLRRLEFVIGFDEPTARERAELWRCHMPPDAPLAPDVDLEELAVLYPLVGGLIRNAAVAAAFQAANAGSPITRPLLVRAIRREYQKSGRAFPGAPPGMTEP